MGTLVFLVIKTLLKNVTSITDVFYWILPIRTFYSASPVKGKRGMRRKAREGK